MCINLICETIPLQTAAVILSLGSVINDATFVHDAPSDAFAIGPECTDFKDEWKQIHRQWSQNQLWLF